uniref:Cytochrome c n=1 Tax=Roseihalotalea indica TaxID=2867963 RepID=A0AA49GM94_9BACT|nr:cytochrome c [Tunicatimonas sp. TK19036]
MFKKVLKFAFIGLGGLLLILLVIYTFAHFSVGKRLEKQYTITPKPITIPSDSASLALGHHISLTQGCQDCHGAKLEGMTMIDDPAIGRVSSSNLTAGEGGIGQRYTDDDWLRALRHGLAQDHTSLMIMPSTEYSKMSDRDIGALIAYCKQVKPVDHVLPENKVGPMARMLINFGQMKVLMAELVDHDYQPPTEVTPTVSASYGKYLAASCAGCHGTNFKGAPGKEPGSPMAADLTRSGNLTKWNEAQFMEVLRTGNTPEGKSMDPKFMPWSAFQHFSDDELKALYLYLQTVD